MRKIVLASASSYRRDLLKRLIKDFECHPAAINEDDYKAQFADGHGLSLGLSKIKAKSVLESKPEALIIGSDQCLVLEGAILGKPHHLEGATAQLMRLQGKRHSLFTSYTLLSKELEYSYTQEVKLFMKKLSAKEIESYLDHDKPFDCAGSYKLEEKGIALFEQIECDDYTGIIGLPLMSLGKKLSEFGYDIF